MIGQRVSPARRSWPRFAALAIAALILTFAFGPLLMPERLGAATPEARSNPDISMKAEPLLGGTFRPGSWVAVRVTVENSGPAIDGELRIVASARAASSFGLPVQLASGARQQHFLYGQTGAFGNRFVVSLLSGGTAQASADVRFNSIGSGTLGVFLVAERPEALVGSIRDALEGGGGPEVEFVSLPPEDLPQRVEAWSPIDVLVWHDVESGRLETAQLDALRTWTLMGGDLVVLAGSTGASSLAGFPAELLPYRPSDALDLRVADLVEQFGSLSGAPAWTTALAGTLERGTSLLQVGDSVIAARSAYGQGTVSLIGLDPTVSWLSESVGAGAFWKRIVPAGSASVNLRLAADDEFLTHSLANLPSVRLPRSDHLMLLILAYIVAIGPVNYVLLKRRDRREWAWLTMPLTIATFSIAAYGFGAVVKGADIVVNELVIVHGAAGTDRGLAEAHVGIFSPGRASFEVQVGGDALVSSSSSTLSGERIDRPIDVLQGDPARVRDYQVGFGALRTFRAQAAVNTPRLEADLRLVGRALEGTITNASAVEVADVTLLYAGASQRLGDMAAGESHSVELSPVPAGRFSDSLSWHLYPSTGAEDMAAARSAAARQALVQHLDGGWNDEMMAPSSRILSRGPVILAWRSASTLDVELGAASEHAAETLYVLPARVQVAGHVVFSGGMLEQVAVLPDAIDAWNEGANFFLGRGTLAVEYRPVEFEGTFQTTGLSFRVGFRASEPAAEGEELLPLPADEQPDSEAPLSSTPRAGEGDPEMPRLQLFDRVAGRWIEFAPIELSRTYAVGNPARYVDATGSFRVRFVVRGSEFANFWFSARLEGDVE